MAEFADIKVTVLDTATVLEGPTTSYRYDLTGNGVLEGWATAGLVSAIAEMLPGVWPAAKVELEATPAVRSVLEEVLRDAGASVVTQPAFPTSPSDAANSAANAAAPWTSAFPPIAGGALNRGIGSNEARSAGARRDGIGDADDAENGSEYGGGFAGFQGAELPDGLPAAEQSRRGTRARSLRGRRALGAGQAAPGIGWHHIGIAVVVLVVILGAVGLVRFRPDAHDDLADKHPSAKLAPSTSATQSRSAIPPGSVQRGEPKSSEPASGLRELRFAALRVRLPEGYRLAQKEGSPGLVMATGPDPEVRILLAVDPVTATDAAAVYAELERMIDEDAQLDAINVHARRGQARAMEYLERPGDGSSVTWTVWVSHGSLYSVGCHSHRRQTTPHRAACRQAIASLETAEASEAGEGVAPPPGAPAPGEAAAGQSSAPQTGVSPA